MSFLGMVACIVFGGCSGHRPVVPGRSETAERLSEQARQALDRGDSRSAENLLTAAVERNPGDGETRLELSELQLDNGSVGAAALHFKRLIEQHPNDPRAYVGLAEAMYRQRNLTEADSLLSRSLEIDARQARALLLRGKIEHVRRHDERALENYYQVLSIDSDHVEAKMLIAELHFDRGDPRLAAPLLRSIVANADEGNPQRDKAHWLLGLCYARDGRWSDASRSLRAGIASQPGTAQDWYVVADACWRAGDTRGAEAAVEQQLRLAPADPQGLALRAALDDRARASGIPREPVVTRVAHDDASAQRQPPADGPRPQILR